MTSAQAGARIRVLQVTHNLQPGGLQRVVETLCRGLDATRFDVRVLCIREGGPLAEKLEKDLGIPIYVLHERPDAVDYLAFWKVRRYLGSHPVDVVHTHNTEPFFDGAIGATLAGVPTIIHTDHAREWPDRFRWMLIEHILSYLAYRVVGCSQNVTDALRRYERIPEKKLLTIPNGIDGALYDTTIDRSEKRRALSIDPNGFVIGFASRLEPEKNCAMLLRAFAMVLESRSDAYLVIAGDGSEKASLESLADALGVRQHVRFLGVRMDVPDLIKTFDVHALPSKREGLPMILLETMAAGCPTVATRVGGLPAIIESGQNGELVEPGSHTEMANALLRLAGDLELRKRYADGARQSFLAGYDARIMVSRYAALYQGQPDVPVPANQ